MRLYVAGKMTGLPEFGYPAFEAAMVALRGAGFTVESPHEPGQVEGWGWVDYMRRGLVQMLSCDGVAVLPGWEDSHGASIEVGLARSLEMPVRPVEEWLLR